MKYLITILMLLFVLSGNANSEVLISEDFESGTPPSGWPCKNIPGSCTASGFNDWYGRNFDCAVTGGQESDLNTEIKRGTRSYYQYRASGANYACDLRQAIAGDPPKIYVSFWIYFPSSVWDNWTINNTEQGDDQGHFFFLNSGARGPNRIVVDICDAANGAFPGQCWQSGIEAAYFKFYWGGDDTQFGSGASYCWNIINNTDSWHQIIWMFDRANSKFGHWIDGTQVVGTDGNGIDQSFGDLTNITAWIFSAYRSENVNVVQAYYLDDIIIATELSDIITGSTTQSISGGVTLAGATLQ